MEVPHLQKGDDKVMILFISINANEHKNVLKFNNGFPHCVKLKNVQTIPLKRISFFCVDFPQGWKASKTFSHSRNYCRNYAVTFHCQERFFP